MLFKKTFKLKKSLFNTTNNIHIVERYLLALKKLQIKNDNLGLDFFLSKELEKSLITMKILLHGVLVQSMTIKS